MKTLTKIIVRGFVFSIFAIGLISCNDTNIEEEMPQEIVDPYEVSIGFSLALQPGRDMDIEHNYEKTGYKVTIKGGLVDGDMELTDVDLNQPILLEVTGEIEVTVKHPDFKKKKLGTVAYYGLDKYDVATSPGAGVISVPLELIQGYVAVEANDFMELFIEKVKIGKDEVELNTIYYTDETKKDIKVEVDVFDNEIKGEHQNVIGEGVVYEVTFSDAIGGSQSQKNIKFEDLYFNINRYSY
ncbi:hypothetical protein [Flavicella marina]|uniref:hypothetical protein n=1 Tax=Flavicella marina TaxID=1475951 RepID=UPI001264C8A0|nr:hypothetical protein [Flavicella marina]